jgi:beta-N-acetylhexosaminidase
MLSAFITGLAGAELSAREAAVLRAARPCGVILFARNAVDPGQLRRLADAATTAVGDEILILIDQEGGRVQRLRPPHWRTLPPAAAYGKAYAENSARALRAAHAAARLTAADLRRVGINTNCAPLLDLPVPGSHGVIGDRAYGESAEQVVALGAAVAEGYMAGGVLPVMKHLPGHGRATADSHFDLPVVTATLQELDGTDFEPFRRLAYLPAAMTAHVVFTAIDADAPASISRRVTEQVIRGAIGFDGLLISDDLAMKALSGSVAERAAAMIAAGSDLVLACNGGLVETEAVAAVAPSLEGRARARFDRACAVFRQQQPFELAEAEACLAEVLHQAA